MSVRISALPTKNMYTVDSRTHVGPVELRIASLDRSLSFYQRIIGLEVISRQGNSAMLGVAGTVLLILHEVLGAKSVPHRATGLYHFAILVPTPADLGHLLRRMLVNDIAVGQGDHLVSEALYLSDPDGNGIEVYRDRPRDTWRWQNGMVQMATDPVDLHALLAAAELDGSSATTLSAATTMGHVHLKVSDIAQARAFFVDMLGFEITAEMPSALFISAGGYHHHFGLNIWQSRNGIPAPADAAGLTSYTIIVANVNVHDSLMGRLDAAGIAYTHEDGGIMFFDPWKNRVIIAVEAIQSA